MFAQHQMDDLVPEWTAYDHLRARLKEEPESKVRARVASLGLGTDKMDTKAKALSGGEKARLTLGLATLDAPHLLILDEPTNHLDIDSRAALIEALNDYTGAVILVSHDRSLLEACAERLWIVADGTVRSYDDDLDAYRQLILRGPQKSAAPVEIEEEPVSFTSKQDRRKLVAQRRTELAPLRKKISEIEALMEKATKLIQVIDKEFLKPEVAANGERIKELSRKRSETQDMLADWEAQWMEMSSKYEEGMAEYADA